MQVYLPQVGSAMEASPNDSLLADTGAQRPEGSSRVMGCSRDWGLLVRVYLRHCDAFTCGGGTSRRTANRT